MLRIYEFKVKKEIVYIKAHSRKRALAIMAVRHPSEVAKGEYSIICLGKENGL